MKTPMRLGRQWAFVKENLTVVQFRVNTVTLLPPPSQSTSSAANSLTLPQASDALGGPSAVGGEGSQEPDSKRFERPAEPRGL